MKKEKLYMSCRIVTARRMCKDDAEILLGKILKGSGEDGYLITYEDDGHEGWCPKRDFERRYKPVNKETHNFSTVLMMLKSGCKIRRAAWKDIDFLSYSSKFNQISVAKDGNVDRAFAWKPTLTDILADDWILLDPKKG